MRRAAACITLLLAFALAVAGPLSHAPKVAGADENTQTSKEKRENETRSAVNFNHQLDGYTPKKDHYNFYFTYKIVHAWWDAVALGMEDAQRQFLNDGVTITYQYLAPKEVSAEDQIQRLRTAANGPYDVIGVDVADEEKISPLIDELIDSGSKVMTFSSSDAAKDCKRISYVGNTHNYEDGVLITKELCKRLGFKGKIAILVGNEGVPCHEYRARGARETISKYDGMEVVEVAYDHDSMEQAQKLTAEILSRHDDLAGIVCCNMSNPVGAARAVLEAKRDIVIVGMDHDQEALGYLKDGVIYCLGVQDCYSIGFDTLQTAVKIADGVQPGDLYPKKLDEPTTIIYQDEAQTMIEVLYGDVD